MSSANYLSLLLLIQTLLFPSGAFLSTSESLCCLTALRPPQSRKAVAQCFSALCKKPQRGAPSPLEHPQAPDPAEAAQRGGIRGPEPRRSELDAGSEGSVVVQSPEGKLPPGRADASPGRSSAAPPASMAAHERAPGVLQLADEPVQRLLLQPAVGAKLESLGAVGLRLGPDW